MPLETSSLHQKAVLWPFAAYDSNGEPTVSTPTEISVRWEFAQRLVDAETSALIPVDGEIWVDQAVAPGSILWKGLLEDLPSPATVLYEVVSYEETPDLKGRVFERVVSVRRYGNSLPTVV